jgi:hypothetical protein
LLAVLAVVAHRLTLVVEAVEAQVDIGHLPVLPVEVHQQSLKLLLLLELPTRLPLAVVAQLM